MDALRRAATRQDFAAVLQKAAVRFGSLTALHDISLEIEQGAFWTILGPSGCGKSTMLRLISDLVPAAKGDVTILGKTTKAARLAREFAFVFQDATLLPWRTALRNVELPLEIGRRKGVDIPTGDRSPRELLALVGLHGREDALPHELSGGMRQRVAIARALVCQPKLMLMDEPFGALDEMTRDRLNMQLLSIWEETGVTILFVTHSIPEAVFLGQRVLMMKSDPGRIMEVVKVELPAPREIEIRDTREFTAYTAYLRQLLEAA
ncbi:MAG: ABC transporter ATP-binding protein [Rhodobacteraceae bacterium]|nr:ABC transporter ATP-binding protein [Paracoccaceae bacterium]MCY4198103.1 ABC transporter ATP-binding protein [Paracoccaceae bacterium]